MIDFHTERLRMLTAFYADQSIISHKRPMPSKFRWVGRVHGIESVVHSTVNALDVGNAQKMSALSYVKSNIENLSSVKHKSDTTNFT